MFLLYKYELQRDKNMETGFYICQNEKNEKYAQRKSVQEELKKDKRSIMFPF